MNIFAFLAAINTVVSLLIGIFVYTQNKRSLMNKTFGLFSLSVVVWSAGYFLWQNAKTPENALFWSRVLMVGAILIPILNFHFVLAFLNKVKEQRIALYAGYALFFFFLLSSFSSLFVSGVEQKLEFPFWPNPGILFHPFLFLWVIYVVYGGVLLVKARASAIESLRSQIEYILFATVIGYGGGITNFFLWYDISIPPIGIWAPALYVGIVAYAMVTKQLFGIRIFLTQLLVGIIALLLFINLLASTTPFEYFWKGGLLIAFLVAGYLLIKSVMNEIRQREELEKLSKAKSEFMSIASHQLRTPLSVIKGYVSLLEENSFGGITSKQKEVLEKVFKTNEEMITMVNDLLNVTRAEEGRLQYSFEKTDLAELIKVATKALALTAKQKELTLEYRLPIEPIMVDVDKDKMTQAISNLIDNAIKYTERGGIKITAAIDKTSNMARVSVADTGLGIGEEEIKHLFESFSRGKAGTKSWTKGTGLGLYIAKQFVEAHKGKIWASSEGEGKGSTFFVELPIQ